MTQEQQTKKPLGNNSFFLTVSVAWHEIQSHVKGENKKEWMEEKIEEGINKIKKEMTFFQIICTISERKRWHYCIKCNVPWRLTD